MFRKPVLVLVATLSILLISISLTPTTPSVASPSAQGEAQALYVLSLGGSNQYVEIPHDPALNPTTGFTLEAWVKYGGSTACQTIISKGYQSAYWLGLCSGRIRFYPHGSGSSQDGNATIPGNVWTHIAVVYRGSGREYYINGELDYQGGPELAPTTNTLPVRIGSDSGASACCDYEGRLSNVRLWNVVRSQDDIRRTMHVAIDAPWPGLVANWRFNGDYEDNIGGYHGSSVGASLSYEVPPAQPAYADVVDQSFNTLPSRRYAAATAYVPGLDRVLVIGGRSGSPIVDEVDAVDAATGSLTTLATLPTNLANAAAVYVPTTDLVYVFGGHTTSSALASAVDTIYAVNPATGDASVISATLPNQTFGASAVYHPAHDKVYLLGGRSPTGVLDTISVFDPASQTLTATVGIGLPMPLYGQATAYSPVTERIYAFGGYTGLSTTDDIYEVALNADGSGGTVSLLSPSLFHNGYDRRAVVDPQAQLIYLVGGLGQEWLWVFDPVVPQIWRTRIAIPESLESPSVAFSPRQRHMLVIGGGAGASDLKNVWRIPLGTGPLVPLGRWGFPTPVGASVKAIDGSGDTVVIATGGSGAYRIEDGGTRYQYTPGSLGSVNGFVHDASLSSAGTIRLATDDAGAAVDNGSTVTIYGSTIFGTDQIYSVGRGAFYGTNGEGLWRQYYSAFPPPGGTYWSQHFAGQSIKSIAVREPGDLYVLTPNNLKRLQYSSILFGGTETDYGSPCALLSLSDLAFGDNGDWWIVAPGNEFGGDGICRILAASTPGTGGTVPVSPALGEIATTVDVDRDGRVWVSLADNGGDASGGLVVFGVDEGGASQVTSSEFNWLNAPIGDDTGSTLMWDSTVSAVGAVEERVWAGKEDGRLVTLAQRWQQVDQNADVSSSAIQNVWTARGRAFMATSNAFYVLLPDGRTWDSRSSIRVWDVLGDRQGRIWAATNVGIRLYTDAGWDYLTDREGVRPATATYALAEDQGGRIWIGGLYGLTLFDRDRFVATFSPSNSGLPDDTIRTLFVDRDNRLWAGTDVGLTRLDGSTWTVFTTADGLPNNQIYDINQLGTGEIAISTFGGLSLYDGSTFTTQALPIPDANLPISVDEIGRLWAGNAVRIGGTWHIHYDTNSGLASSEISDSATDGADRIWFSHAPDLGVSVRGTYLPPLDNVLPFVSGVSPATGQSGDEIVITGSGFGDSESDIEVTVGQGQAQVIDVSPGEIRVRLTDFNTSGRVSVTAGRRRTEWSGSFCAIPTVASFSPTGGNDGVRVHVYGQNFDPAADIYLGSTNDRAPHVVDATHLWLDIRPEDGTGAVRVVNQCADESSSAETFRRIEVTLEQIVLNQGIESMGLVADRPTLAQFYLSHSVAPRPTDRLEVDYVQLTFSEPGQAPFVHRLRVVNEDADADGVTDAPTLFTLDGPPTRADLRDIDNSFNVIVTPDLVGGLPPIDSPVGLDAHLQRGGQVVAQGTDTFGFRRDLVLRVLLVPILENGDRFNAAALNDLRNTTNGGLANLRQRIFPTGRVEFYWSPVVYEANDVLITDESVIDIGDTFTLYDASHNLDFARRTWNDRRDPDVLIAFGVVDPDVNNGSATGKAFWPDLAQMINASGLSALDAVCDVGAAILDLFTFGLAGDEGCDLEVPLYVGWGVSTSNSSHLIGHEMGHTLGLARPPAPNANLFDNFSHSTTDEIDQPGDADGETCGDLLQGNASYDVNATLYRSPGVWEPVVNPLRSGSDVQIRARLGATETWTITEPTTVTTTSEALAWRGKAIMSYACNIGNDNTFYEPADMPGIFFEYAAAPARGYVSDLTPLSLSAAAAVAPQAPPVPSPIPVVGDRLYVSGQVDRLANTGILRRVIIIGQNGPVDASYETGYWLVQRDGSGTELARSGVYPVFGTSDDENVDAGFFATTIVAASGIARIDLYHDGTLLDTFSAGGSTPTISLSSPTGGSYSSGAIPVTWQASDGDGDDLEISIFYSPDAGTSWTPVGFSRELSGTKPVAVGALAGGKDARIKVVASDGFRSAEAVSPQITVEAQPPQPYIDAPEDGASILEGDPVTLIGGANDNQDQFVDAANLSWSSDRDGNLGTGEVVNVLLSVGTHILTLDATNSLGVGAATSITVTVQGDYDYDGIPDSEELADGLNLLSAADARSDTDGDGLTLLVERKRGLNPNEKDSDGDGRDDDVELAEGTDPGTADSPLAPDALSVYPASLTFDQDLSGDTAMPQAQVQLFSRETTSWTLTSDVDWLAATRAQGDTPGSTLIIVNTENLPEDGTYTGNLFFSSSLGTVTVPVTATVTNLPESGSKVYLPLVLRQ